MAAEYFVLFLIVNWANNSQIPSLVEPLVVVVIVDRVLTVLQSRGLWEDGLV